MLDCAVGDIVDVSSELVTALPFGDEGTELDVLDSDLLCTDTCREDIAQGFVCERGRTLDLTKFLLRQVLIHTLEHPVVGDLSRVGDEGEDRMTQITSDSTEDGGSQLLPKSLAFPINIRITSTREVNTLEATSCRLLWLDDLLQTHLSLTINQEGLPWA